MSDFCYIIDDQNGTRLYLAEAGPQEETAEQIDMLRRDGFRHAEERRIGACVLHIFERDLQATDIVPGEHETESGIDH